MSNSAGDVVLGVLWVIAVLCVDHWIISSLFVGVVGTVICLAINSEARTDAGAVISGVLAYGFGILGGFGGFAAFLYIVKSIWNAV